MSDDDLLSTTEVARICDVTPYTVRRWIRTGKIKSAKLGGSYQPHHRIRRSELHRFLQERVENG